LRDIVVKQAAGIAVEDTPLHHEVVERCNGACDHARANHASYVRTPRAGRRNLPITPDIVQGDGDPTAPFCTLPRWP
jgi:hypothetical protein